MQEEMTGKSSSTTTSTAATDAAITTDETTSTDAATAHAAVTVSATNTAADAAAATPDVANNSATASTATTVTAATAAVAGSANMTATTMAPVSASTTTRTDSADGSCRPIDVISLYPRDMNIYGDSGNVLTITRRLTLYGYQPRVHELNQGDPWPEHVDMILGGGGQDTGQKKIIDDLFLRADTLREFAADGVPMLMICGLYQLFGHYFETIDGTRLDGIGIIGAHTIGRDVRMIGNLVEHSEQFGDIIGYENHSGQTFLDNGVQPLGKVEHDGTGNNGTDHTEGARVNNVIGTYMHGSLLPKNPAISDYLIRSAAEHRYGTFEPQQTGDQQAELKHIDEIATRARAVAASRPR